MKNLNEYQFNEWRPHITEETADYGNLGMYEAIMRRSTAANRPQDMQEAEDSITTHKTGTWQWEWVNPARGEVHGHRDAVLTTTEGTKHKTRGFSSRRSAHDAAQEYMAEQTGGKPDEFSYEDAAVMDDEKIAAWKKFHQDQGHDTTEVG